MLEPEKRDEIRRTVSDKKATGSDERRESDKLTLTRSLSLRAKGGRTLGT
jgi:hypothetical protein